jgi:hypothetical protein
MADGDRSLFVFLCSRIFARSAITKVPSRRALGGQCIYTVRLEKMWSIRLYFDRFQCMSQRTKIASLSDSDIRLLRVFQAVVRQQGFAAAQSELGLSPATISNHIAHLETRLGVRLCSRGRKGFALTPEGARLHEASLNLLRSVENFSTIVGSVRGHLTGSVHFGTVDAIYTNGDLDISSALAEFSKRAPPSRAAHRHLLSARPPAAPTRRPLSTHIDAD